MPATPTSPDDSIRQAWRSSTQGCLDVPDSHSSVSPYKSPTRLVRGRARGRGTGTGMQSAPDVLKYSPPTPPPSSPTRPDLTVSTETGDRIHAISLNPPIGGCPPRPSSPLGPKDPSMKRTGTNVISSTPTLSRKVQRISPTADIPVTPPAKRLLQPARIIAPVQTPITTPVPQTQRQITKNPLETHIAKIPNKERQRKKLRPLSLRSRLKLATRLHRRAATTTTTPTPLALPAT